MKRTMRQIVDTYLDQSDLIAYRNDEGSTLVCLAKPNGIQYCFVRVDEADRSLSVNAYAGARIPEHRRAEVAVWVVRANFNLVSGRFDLDMDTGDLCFSMGMYFGSANPPRTVLDYLFEIPSQVMESNLTEVMEIAFRMDEFSMEGDEDNEFNPFADEDDPAMPSNEEFADIMTRLFDGPADTSEEPGS